MHITEHKVFLSDMFLLQSEYEMLKWVNYFTNNVLNRLEIRKKST